MTSRPCWPDGQALAGLDIDHLGDDAGQRLRATAGLGGRGAGERADHDAAGFGLPPGIDDRAAAAADLLVIPHPGFRIDRLADGAEQPQARQVVLLGHWSPHLMNARMAVGAV